MIWKKSVLLPSPGILLSLLTGGMLMILSCSRTGSSDTQTQSPKEHETLIDKIADSLHKTPATTLQKDQREVSPSKAALDTLTSSKPLPPPKKEAWMDTLTDLSGIPAPNAAVLIEDEPIPQNLNSVAILISHRYRAKTPIDLTLRVYVTEAGTVKRYQLLRNSDPKLGPEYFVHPLLELRFSPATQNGKPIPAWTTLNLKIPKSS
ncbi:MAG: energy transducer TonB [Bacteroidia bacterium]|nr:energy transducer TonB [Bacteroidia bacterium]